MKKIKVMSIFGTRPEAIKMAPIILELKENSDAFESVTVITAQHRQMLDQVLDIFRITPDFDLDIMKANQTLSQITSRILVQLDIIIEQEKPDIILVHGDTTTSFAASLSAFYHHIKLGHVEAGLRTWNKYSPFPEEMNRQMTDILSDMYFAPTQQSYDNLIKENHIANNIYITGNTAIDALKKTVNDDYNNSMFKLNDSNNKMILVTMHRRENQGVPMLQVFQAIRKVVDAFTDIEVVYPVHLSPSVQKVARDVLGNHERIHLIKPLDVIDFHNLSAQSYFIMTDSGGVQEEAPSLGKPVLVLRDTTERPEGVEAGTLKLVGTKESFVMKAMTELLGNPKIYQTMAMAKNPYGDGHAARNIVSAIQNEFNSR
ncbi:UDP-N-acetylglucosamine 2-epimerase (non-hydrolyzing) [Weissella coleopterorum]|uniref:UDP-N-acetylglucosamine 2-epimerase (non-hydrolyzing) n=1 Tax=Weissella coleopterorum TaxID=2714949 RepID=A0A6G8B0K4_9LACO|nr:UDP-N-acetylglucosamine 2-epimerase (non-hydrolyzing) [Weissella coleopterorum]QIL50745.1 UDP-N-acetylglucosamine 2-epimerase (non-hydrolyzing) [Weissella coleopterorum]